MQTNVSNVTLQFDGNLSAKANLVMRNGNTANFSVKSSNQNGFKYWQKGQVHHPLSYCGKIFFWFGYLESRFSREVAAFLVICTLITAFLDKGQAL